MEKKEIIDKEVNEIEQLRIDDALSIDQSKRERFSQLGLTHGSKSRDDFDLVSLGLLSDPLSGALTRSNDRVNNRAYIKPRRTVKLPTGDKTYDRLDNPALIKKKKKITFNIDQNFDQEIG